MFRLTPDGDYIQGMYIRAPDFKPEPASDEIEQCLQDYEAAIRAERRRILRHHKRNPPIPNLTVLQQSLITQLRGRYKHTLKVMDADKNLGQAITTTEFATKQTIEEHLSDGNVYRRLTEQLASANQEAWYPP